MPMRLRGGMQIGGAYRFEALATTKEEATADRKQNSSCSSGIAAPNSMHPARSGSTS